MNDDLIERVRRLCLALPGTSERLSHGEPTFFVGKRVFVMFANNHHGDGHVAVWLPVPPGVQSALIEQSPAVYFRPPYVGHKGWVGIELAHIGEDALEFHVQTAWELIAPRRLLQKPAVETEFLPETRFLGSNSGSMSDEPMRLIRLAARETMLDTRLAAARAIRGLTEESPEYRAIFADYAAIHREYVDLAMSGDEEALKRALFLQWYRVTEPWFLCGLSDLDEPAEQRLLTLVDRLCASNRLDDELSWMLPYYYLIADYYFQHEGHCPALVAYCQANQHWGIMEQPAGFVSKGRGQMGEYWESIFKSSSNRRESLYKGRETL